MFVSRFSIATLSLTTALVVVSPFVSLAKEKPVIDLQSQSKWSATMIEGRAPEDGYCALTQKYNQGVVLTLGQSMRDEYSLAIDFQDQKLNTEKAYKVTLQPGPGQIRAYEIMPASQQAMVVRLGYDESFFKALESSNLLKAEIDSKAYQFGLLDIQDGRTKLKTCMAGLKGEDVKSVSPVFSAEKLENAEPIDAIKQAVKSEVKKPVEGVTENSKTKVKKEVKDVVKVVEKEAPKEATKEVVEIEEKKKTIEMARVDSVAIIPTLDILEVTLPAPVITMQEDKVKTKTEIAKKAPEVTVPEVELPKVKTAQIDEPKMAKAVVPKAKVEVEQRVSVAPKNDIATNERPDAVAAKNKNYGSVSQAPNPAQSAPAVIPENVKMAIIKEKAPIEMAKPMPAPKVEAKESVKVKSLEVKSEITKDVTPVKKIEILKTETKKITPKISSAPSKEDPRSLVDEKIEVKIEESKPDQVNPRVVETEKKLKETKKQLEALEKENRSLYLEARQARGQIDTAVVETGNEALKKIRTYERKLEAAQADNLALAEEVEILRRSQEDQRMSAVQGDPDMKKSMRRYNEAEREIKRLGLLLEQQRLAHRQEKQELEGMLFDPAVTDQVQRQRLADLEAKLAEAERHLQAEALKVNKVDLQSQKKLQEMERKLEEARAKEDQLKVHQKKVEMEAQALKIEAEKLAASKVKLEMVREKEKQLKAEEARLQAEAKKIAQLETQRIAQAQAKLAAAKAKEEELRRQEGVLRAQSQAMKVAEEKLAVANKREQEIKAAEKRLTEKSQKIAKQQQQLQQTRAASLAQKEERQPVAQNIRPLSPIQRPAQKVPPPLPAPEPSFSLGNIQQLLNRSGISSVSSITQQTANRYSWNAAGMTGKAEIANGGENLSQFTQSYIALEKKKCRGDFASLPATLSNGKQGYEIACVGPNGGKSSSVVFAQKQGALVAIAHETTADNMDAAIDARDKVASQL